VKLKTPEEKLVTTIRRLPHIWTGMATVRDRQK